eukprot:jgi/Botrbrau1/8275/Bobra.0251s0004.1
MEHPMYLGRDYLIFKVHRPCHFGEYRGFSAALRVLVIFTPPALKHPVEACVALCKDMALRPCCMAEAAL